MPNSAFPAGLRWVAEHQPDGYDPPRRFVDSIGTDGLASLPIGLAVRWRHTHDFEEVSDERTRVTDRVDTPVPARALRAMFRYRHRQLADYIAVHRRAAAARIGSDDGRHHRLLRAGRRSAESHSCPPAGTT